MAPTFQASKFALLPDDDEDLNKKALRALKNGKTDTKVDNAKTKSKAKKKNKKKNSEATPPPDPSNGDSNKNEKKTQPESSNNEQFSTWLSHDKQVNDEAFAQDLQNAILASKIDHVAEPKKSQNGPPGMSKQNKKSATMTLQDFNNLSLNQDANSQPNSNLPAVTETETFFEDVEEATKKALNREQIKDSLDQRYNHLPDQALLKQYRSILESKDTEIVKLNNTNQMLTNEVEKVKKRYKVFRELLDQVECREKAEVVGENMKLKKVQAEISKELDLLREENEKLKTKVASNERMKILSDKLKERKAEQKTEKE